MTSQGVLGQQCWKTVGCSVLTACSILVLRLVIKGREQSHLTTIYCRYQVRFCMLRACYDAEVCKPAGASRLFYSGRGKPREMAQSSAVVTSNQVLLILAGFYLCVCSWRGPWMLSQLQECCTAAVSVVGGESWGGFFPVVCLGPVGEAGTGSVMWEWLCVMALRYKALLQTIFYLCYSF